MAQNLAAIDLTTTHESDEIEVIDNMPVDITAATNERPNAFTQATRRGAAIIDLSRMNAVIKLLCLR